MIKCLICEAPLIGINDEICKDRYECIRCICRFQVIESVIWFSKLITTSDYSISHSEWKVWKSLEGI